MVNGIDIYALFDGQRFKLHLIHVKCMFEIRIFFFDVFPCTLHTPYMVSNLILQNGKIQIKHSQFGYGNSERPPVIVTSNEVLKLYNFIIILVGYGWIPLDLGYLLSRL